MSIEKKSLISALKTTKKANVAKENFSHTGSSNSSVKSPGKVLATKATSARSLAKLTSGKAARSASNKVATQKM